MSPDSVVAAPAGPAATAGWAATAALAPTAWTTRIAPTPSGYLHEGNAVNMLLTAWWAAATGGRLLLRIDDFDVVRMRPEYLADVFHTLEWLGIDPDDGPRDPQGFAEHWSMARHRDRIAAARDRLLVHWPEHVFVCRCSRRELDAQGFCSAGCRDASLEWIPGHTVVRLRVIGGAAPGATPARADTRSAPGTATGCDPRATPGASAAAPGAATAFSGAAPAISGAATAISCAATAISGAATAASGSPTPPLAAPAGDHVLWRRDDEPAYQLGSVVVDEALGVTAILRGADLLDSSALQLRLAALLPASGFLRTDLRHHALVRDVAGHKLSKSAGTRAAPLDRTAALLASLRRRAVEVGAPLGIAPPP